jgi:xanthine dehydrogenase/oxidase
VDLQQHEVLLRASIPFTRRHEYVREFKQAHRRDDDIAIVNAGMRVVLSQNPSGGRGASCGCEKPMTASPPHTWTISQDGLQPEWALA